MRQTKPFAVLLVLLSLGAISLPWALALPPLENNVVFPAGSFVIPMDEKQAEKVVVFGFVHALLRSPNPIQIFRVIEPPNVTIATDLSASPKTFTGGPFLVLPGDASKVQEVRSRPGFEKVTVGTLSSQHTLNNIFRVTEPTKILVVKTIPPWGRTDLTLDAMKIPYNITTRESLTASPGIIFSYSLIVIDCYGWAGNTPPQVASNLRDHVSAGNEVIFTDIAIKDMNATFPGYVNLWGPQSRDRTANAFAYNPSRKYGSADRFTPEFPSQYYNTAPSPNQIKVFTESAGYVVSSIPSGKTNDVRILVDSTNYGATGKEYAILAFYFQYGEGIVEGLAFHPQQQDSSHGVDAKGRQAVYQMYGNKFVHGIPSSSFELKGAPPSRSVPQNSSTTYLITVQSHGKFNVPVALSVTPASLPPGVSASFAPAVPQPPEGGNVNSTMRVNVSLTAPVGNYSLNVTGTPTVPGIAAKSIILGLNVTMAPADFTISVSPNALSINVTETKSATVAITSVGPFSENVTLNVTGLPPHVTVTFEPPAPRPGPFGATAYSVMRIVVGADATNGTYPLMVRGTAGNLTHSTPFTLTIVKTQVPAPPIPWILVLLLALLGIALGLIVTAIAFRKRVAPAPGAQRMYVVPAAAHQVRCPRCGRPIAVNAVYCPFCGQRRGAVAVGAIAGPVPIPVSRIAVRGRRAFWGFILAMVSAILILINAAALLSPTFWGAPTNWSLIFWWLDGPAGLGQSIGVLVGVISGFVVMTGGFMMILRKGVFGAALALPFAVISVIIGGGFLIGMVLGIVSGIMGALGR